jgi:hypothetical protein
VAITAGDGPVVGAAAWVLESEAAKDADIGARPSAAIIGPKIKKAAFRGGPGSLLIRARLLAVNASGRPETDGGRTA